MTVTDAHVWLGRLPADAFLGGAQALDRDAIRGPLTTVADALGSSLDDAAEGIVAVADTAMERALRVISVERGYDPADFALVGFGGAGGLHVVELTHRLGALGALVPPDPGLLSAYGMLASPVTRETARTVLEGMDSPGAQRRLDETFTELEEHAIREMLDEGAARSDLQAERWVDARYRGQSFELRVPADGWVRRFHHAHEERYGYRRDETPVEAVTVRAVVTAPRPRLDVPELSAAEGPPPTEPTRVVYAGETIDAVRAWRHDLGSGHVLAGPAVIQEYSGTTWVPPGWTVSVDLWGSLGLTRRG